MNEKIIMNQINKISILVLLLANLVFSQNDIDNAIRYTLKLDRKNVFPSEVVTVIADIKLMKDYYVYSSHPEKTLSPSHIEWMDSSYIDTIGILKEPKPKIKYDKNFNMEIGYHLNELEFRQDLKIAKQIEFGKHNLEGTFIYQVCDPIKCIPHWDDFSLEVHVENGLARKEYSFIIQTEFEKKEDDIGINNNDLDEVIDKGLFSFIVFALGMGFLALLTPCVFPMIPITVSFFTKQCERENNNPLKSAIIYALIIAIFIGKL